MVRSYKAAQKADRIGKYFTVGDLWPDASRSEIKLDDALVALLDKFVERFGKMPVFTSKNAIFCTSGHTSGSYHYKGMAADFSMQGVTPLDLAQYAEVCKAGGIGVYEDKYNHIHVDVRSGTPARWWIITSNSKTPGFGGVPATFKKGHRSPAIKLVQARLNQDGYDCGKTDGDFGDKTDAALRRWQASHGLTIDGAFGKLTNMAMGLFQGW